MSDWRAAPLIDHGQIDDFTAILPRDQVLHLIRGFARELETRPAIVLGLVDAGDIAGAQRAAHLLRGVALNLGGTRIATLAGAVERAGAGTIGQLATMLPDCADDTLAALARIERTVAAA